MASDRSRDTTNQPENQTRGRESTPKKNERTEGGSDSEFSVNSDEYDFVERDVQVGAAVRYP